MREISQKQLHENVAKHRMLKQKAHEHVYVQHYSWPTHAVCEICGFAVVKTALQTR